MVRVCVFNDTCVTCTSVIKLFTHSQSLWYTRTDAKMHARTNVFRIIPFCPFPLPPIQTIMFQQIFLPFLNSRLTCSGGPTIHREERLLGINAGDLEVTFKCLQQISVHFWGLLPKSGRFSRVSLRGPKKSGGSSQFLVNFGRFTFAKERRTH